MAAVLATVTALSLSWNLFEEMQLDNDQWNEYSGAIDAERMVISAAFAAWKSCHVFGGSFADEDECRLLCVQTRAGLMREAHVLGSMLASQLPPSLPPGLPKHATICADQVRAQLLRCASGTPVLVDVRLLAGCSWR